MGILPFPTEYVNQDTAPLFEGRIVDQDTGQMMTKTQCYKITLNVVCEPRLSGKIVPVDHYQNVDVPADCLAEITEAEKCAMNFGHRCEVYDGDRPVSAFTVLGARYRVEYAFYWKDDAGRERLPVKLLFFVQAI